MELSADPGAPSRPRCGVAPPVGRVDTRTRPPLIGESARRDDVTAIIVATVMTGSRSYVDSLSTYPRLNRSRDSTSARVT
jgi:hypothetical protein